MLGGEGGSSIGVIVLVAGLGLVPFMVVTTTAFMKIAVVLFLIRNALGIQQTPPNLVLYGIAIVLAVFLTSPVVGSVFAEVSECWIWRVERVIWPRTWRKESGPRAK